MEEEKRENKFLAYLRALPKRWFITAFSGMAQGLFVTLIAGTILSQIAGWIGDNYIGNTLLYIALIEFKSKASPSAPCARKFNNS